MFTGLRTAGAVVVALAGLALTAMPGQAQSDSNSRHYPYYNYQSQGAPVPAQTVDYDALRHWRERTPPRYATYIISPHNPPTNMTSINYPLVYGAYIYPHPVGRYTYGAMPSPFTSAPTLYGDYYPTMYAASYSSPGAEPASMRLNSANLTVIVPADAVVRLNGVRTLQRGERRNFIIPNLIPATTYAYDVGVSWRENGQDVVRHRELTFQAGDDAVVDFLNELSGTGVLKTRPLEEGAGARTLRPRPLP
jgi:uncharacterized protein (TIGR03000 family)